jgi:transposase
MKAQELLPPGPGLRADRVDMSGQACSVDAVGRFSAACPECGARSTSRHSRYRRKLQDLPVQGKAVTLHLQMGRWRCRNVGCPRKIFAERVPRVAVPWARRTNRLRDLVCMVGQRVTKWITLPELPMRNTMEPTSHTPDSYHDYLAKRWGEGCRHGRSLLKEIQELGYTGCFSYLARFLASWRRTDKPLRARTKIVSTEANLTSMPLQSCSRRQISPQVASALLGKLRTQMTETQRQTVDTLKSNCPGFTTMRSLVMGFRTILRAGTIKSLHIWMKRAQSSGIYGMQRFVHRLRQDLSAVEAAVTETWSNGPVEGHVARLKTIKRQMYGRAGFELLRARVLPLTTLTRLHQE